MAFLCFMSYMLLVFVVLESTCPSHKFTCGDGSCIDASFRCDEVTDCPDASDEKNCFNTTGNYEMKIDENISIT